MWSAPSLCTHNSIGLFTQVSVKINTKHRLEIFRFRIKISVEYFRISQVSMSLLINFENAYIQTAHLMAVRRSLKSEYRQTLL